MEFPINIAMELPCDGISLTLQWNFLNIAMELPCDGISLTLR